MKYCIYCGVLLSNNNWSLSVYAKHNSVNRRECVCKVCADYHNNLDRINAAFKQRIERLNKLAKKEGSSILEIKDLIQLYEYQGKSCNICGKPLLASQCNIDHIVPRCMGGLTEIGNLQIACAMCNVGKNRWSLEEYIRHCKSVAVWNEWRNFD